MIYTTCFNLLLLELLSGLLLFQAPLDFFFNEKSLAVGSGDKPCTICLKFFLFVVVMLFFELKLRSLCLQ